jgi:regulator of sigma E protease
MVAVDILVFIIVLGLLVFFHELGHFLAAKACNVYVDRFSLGMPPRVAGVRLGETDYCLGALPLGGYVKMAGQEDTPTTDEERLRTYAHVPEERWFNKKPVAQRFVVIAAGPFMNVVLAVLLYGIVAGVGAYVIESDVDNRIGPIAPNSPAATALMYAYAPDGAPPVFDRAPDTVGWQTGDRIRSINGHRIRNIGDVGVDAVLGAGSVMNVEIERVGPDGQPVRYLSPAVPKPLTEDSRARFGVGSFRTALVTAVWPGSPALGNGIQPGDCILRANGKVVDTTTFVEMVEKVPEGETVNLEIQRGSETITVAVQPKTIGRLVGLGTWSAQDLNSKLDENARPVVTDVSSEFAKTTGIMEKDIIESIDGKPATMKLLEEIERSRPGDTITVLARRPAILFGLVRQEQSVTLKLPIAPVRAIGVQLGPKMVFHRVPPKEVVPEAFNLTYQALARVMRTVVMLVSGAVSPRELGGPVLIYQVTTEAARLGYSWLLNITAFISVNLAVFNLLPLPVLDGSLLVYLVLEGIRRKPLNMRVLERIQQVGIVLIVGLLLFVTFNDVSRWFTSLVP